MKCPQCGAWTRVVYTRLPKRTRECGNLHKFSTQEVLLYSHDEKKQDQEDRRRVAAMAKGTAQDVAASYGVTAQSVRNWRKKYRQI
jgi:transposase-like protein